MSLQKARARYYASHFESESSDDESSREEVFEFSENESSEEEYFQVPKKELTPKQRLQKRLEKIRLDFQNAAPSAVAEEKFHLSKDIGFDDNFDPDVYLKRELTHPIQVALEKPSEHCSDVGKPRPLEFEDEDLKWPSLGNSPVVPRVSMDETKEQKNHENFLNDVIGCAGATLISAGFDGPDDESVEHIDDVDAQSGIPSQNESDFHQWLTDKFGFSNVPETYCENPMYEEEALPSEESWGEWPEVDNDEMCHICGEIVDECECDDLECPECGALSPECECSDGEPSETKPDPNPMDIKGNRIAKRLAGLEAELQKIEENKNVLIVEKENLSTQLKACKKRIKELEKERNETSTKIEEVCAEQEAHIAEMDELHSMSDRKKRENQMIDEIKNYLDDFSQAVQILLSSGKYCDFEQLVHAHVKDGMNVQTEVRNSIIKEAKIMKRDQLYATLEAENCYLSPKNADQLPNLYDQYVTDSYKIIQN